MNQMLPLFANRHEPSVRGEPPPAENGSLHRRFRAGEVGYIHSRETGSAVDGPGIRLVFWTTGCAFRCQYCHNPDSWKLQNGTLTTLAELSREMAKYAPFVRAAGGGVTFSGGEPLVQDRFIVRAAALARELGLHVTLDTNGFYGHRLTDEELGRFDLYLLDLKASVPELHQRLVGQPLAPVRAFAERLGRAKRPTWVRLVLVPGLTDSEENVRGVARIAAQMGSVERVDVLPFHQLGRFKWERLGLRYPLANTVPPSPEKVEHARAIFRAFGLNCPA